jgi:hypothetical protein
VAPTPGGRFDVAQVLDELPEVLSHAARPADFPKNGCYW